MANELGRDLLITLALTAEGIERVEQLEKRIEDLNKLSKGEAVKRLRLSVEGIEEAEAKLKQMGLSAEQVEKVLGGMKSRLAKDLKASGLADEMREASSQASAYKQQLEASRKEIERLSALQRKLTRAIGAVQDPTKPGASDIIADLADDDEIKRRIKARPEEDTLGALKGARSEIIEEKRKEVQATRQVRDETEQLTIAQDKLNKVMSKLDDEQKDVAKSSGKVEKELKDQQQQAEKTAESVDKVTKAAKKAGDTAETERKKEKGFLSGFTSIPEMRGGILGAASFATARLGFYAIAASVIFNVQRALRAAVESAVEFEQALRDIQGVLPSKSFQESLRIGDAVVDNAIKYGLGLRETAESAKLFAQTGKDAQEVSEALNAQLQAVRGANLPLDRAREFIIAIERITEGEVEALQILDRISRVESTRAVTAEDLATAIQRIGPLVRQLKGDMVGLVDEFDIAMGAVTSIVERTRVSGANAATSLKFVLSRFGRPKILKQIQELSGVKLARPGGTELRPFSEILQEISQSFQTLRDTGQTARAFEILTTIGGSRQLQATAALLEDFSSTMDTARESSLAFGDAQVRTEISMMTTGATAKQMGSAFGSLSDAIFNTTGTSGAFKNFFLDIRDITTSTADSIRAISNAIDELYITDNISRFGFDLVNISDVKIDEVPQLKRIGEDAEAAGQTIGTFLRDFKGLTDELESDVIEKTGMDLTTLLKVLESPKAGDDFRFLREEMGEKLADALAETIPRFEQMKEALEAVEDPGKKAELQAERISQAYGVLSDVTFATNAVLETNNRRLREAAENVQSLVAQDLAKSLRDVQDTQQELDNLRPESVFQGLLSLDNIKDLSLENILIFFPKLLPLIQKVDEGLQEATASLNELHVTSQRDVFLGSLPKELRQLAFGVFDMIGATEAWKEAVREVNDEFGRTPDAVGRSLDVFAEEFLDEGKSERAINLLQQRIHRTLIQRGEAGSIGAAGEPGSVFLQRFNELLTEAADRYVKLNELTDDEAESVAKLTNTLTSSRAAKAVFLDTLSGGINKTQKKILDLLSSFIIARDRTRQLNEDYRDLGISFDETAPKLDAATALFTGLTDIQNELRKEIILTDQQVVRIQDSLKNIEGLSLEDRELLDKFFKEPLDIEQLSQGQARGLTNISEKVALLRTQLQELDTQSLRDIFGDTQAGQTFFSLFDQFISDVGVTGEQALATFFALRSAAKDLVGFAQQEVERREFNIGAAKEQVEILKAQLDFQKKIADIEAQSARDTARMRSEFRQTILEDAERQIPLIKERLRNEEELADTQSQRIRERTQKEIAAAQQLFQLERDAALERSDGELTEDQERELAAKQAERVRDARREEGTALLKVNNQLVRQTEQILSQNIVNRYTELSKQIQSNVDSATSGLRKILTDFDALNKGALATLLGPIGETFISRTAENLTKELFDASASGFLGRISRAFGEGPESRLKNKLQTALELGGTDIATKFKSASDYAALNIAQAISSGPGGAGSAFHVTPDGRVIGGRKPEIEIAGIGNDPRNLDLTGVSSGIEDDIDWSQIGDQLAVLAGSQLSPALFGGGQGAQIGAQLGAALGTFGGPAGSILGGLAGSALGSLFDDDENKKQTQALSRIEENTRRSADVLELERRMMQVARGAVNVPSRFTIPQFSPSAGGGQNIRQNNRIEANITIQNANDPEAIMDTIRTEFGSAIAEEIKSLGV